MVKESNVDILARDDRWFERVVREAIYVKMEKGHLPLFNRGSGL